MSIVQPSTPRLALQRSAMFSAREIGDKLDSAPLEREIFYTLAFYKHYVP
jgi:hypothetical protein